MAEQFYTILTKIGKAKIANASALGISVNFIKLQVGDSNGSYYNPTEEQTELKHKVWEGNIGAVTIDKDNSNWIVIETVISADQGGFMIREAGVFDDQGNLIAIGKYPETYKPITSEGSSKDLIIRMILEVSNTANVTLKVDPTVILATKKDIQVLQNQINNIKVPVKSVNTKTGDVVLKAEDIKLNNGTTLEDLNNTINEHSVDNTTAAHKAKNILVEDTAGHFTSNPKNLENVLTEVFTNVDNGKNNLYSAIIGKGTTPTSKDFADLATAINSISSSLFIPSVTSPIETIFISFDGNNEYFHQNQYNTFYGEKVYKTDGTLLKDLRGSYLGISKNGYILYGEPIKFYDLNGTLLFSQANKTQYINNATIAFFTDDLVFYTNTYDSSSTTYVFNRAGTLVTSFVAGIGVFFLDKNNDLFFTNGTSIKKYNKATKALEALSYHKSFLFFVPYI